MTISHETGPARRPAPISGRVTGLLRPLCVIVLVGGALAACDAVSGGPGSAAGEAAAARQSADADGYRGVVLDPPIPRPDFVLTDVDGQPYDFRAETRDKLALLFIGYTSCPDVCPLHMANIASALSQHPQLEEKVEVVFITADPERDTPERLKNWLGAFDPRFVGLRGTPEEVHALEASLNLPPSVVPVTGEDGDYSVGHAALVIAFAPGGEGHVGYLSGATPSDYAEDLPKLVTARWDGL